MARVTIEVQTRHNRGDWRGAEKFKDELPIAVFEAVTKLAAEKGVVLRGLQVVENKPSQ